MPSCLSALNYVTQHTPASSADAVLHFSQLLSVETDCWDVHEMLKNGNPSFILIDVRSPEQYAAGHVSQAVNLPHRQMNASTLTAYPPKALLVVYCSGPHCNGADRAALRIAQLGRPVKKMIGGIRGWLDSGFELSTEID